jgi:hypothetical protein
MIDLTPLVPLSWEERGFTLKFPIVKGFWDYFKKYLEIM